MAQSTSNSLPLDRRTLVVLMCLVFSLTGVSGLLLLLEPTPLAPIGGPVLTVLDPSPRGFEEMLNEQEIDEQRWQAIVIHHSGDRRGNASSLGARHQGEGDGGLRYHFVIGNGDGADDGEVQVGYRWNRQQGAPHVNHPEHGEWFNQRALAICVIGDGDRNEPTAAQMQQLVRLVNSLQQRLQISPDRVLLHANIADTTSPGLLFPASAFRQQLLDIEPE